MKAWLEMLEFMPSSVREILKKVPREYAKSVEEVRLRTGKSLSIVTVKPLHISSEGKNVIPEKAYNLSAVEIIECLRLLSNSSLYAWDEELRRGYVTVKGGHRVGLAGRVLTEKGCIRTMKDISSLNFRIAKEITGCADKLAEAVLQARPQNTLLISPPRAGKTTILRDLIRLTSLRGFTVAVVDERSELAASWQGSSQKDLGPNTDIMDACPKAEGLMLMIRSLGPDVVAVDEIGSQEDAHALYEAAKAGVNIYATAHASNLQEALERSVLKELILNGVFKKIVQLHPHCRGEYSITDYHRGLKVC